MRENRKKVWIDRLQTHVCLYVAAYVLLYHTAVWGMTIISQNVTAPLQITGAGGAKALGISFAVIVQVMLCGAILYDVVLFTHRVVGPLYRFRQIIKAVTSGDEVALIHLRKRDYLVEMKDEINEMLKTLEESGAVVLRTTSAELEEKQAVPV
jgi:nitrogen fixation/metabolism regulation signal transduction histidine kinase